MDAATAERLIANSPYAGSILGAAWILRPVLAAFGAWVHSRIEARDAREAKHDVFLEKLVKDFQEENRLARTEFLGALAKLTSAVEALKKETSRAA